jgi:hypothetical protein
MAEILSGGGGTPLKLNTGGLVKHLSEGSSALTEEEKKRLAQYYQSYNSDGASTTDVSEGGGTVFKNAVDGGGYNNVGNATGPLADYMSNAGPFENLTSYIPPHLREEDETGSDGEGNSNNDGITDGEDYSDLITPSGTPMPGHPNYEAWMTAGGGGDGAYNDAGEWTGSGSGNEGHTGNIGGYTSFADMFDGGGPGTSGVNFEGGIFSNTLNNMGVNPYGYTETAATNFETKPGGTSSGSSDTETVSDVTGTSVGGPAGGYSGDYGGAQGDWDGPSFGADGGISGLNQGGPVQYRPQGGSIWDTERQLEIAMNKLPQQQHAASDGGGGKGILGQAGGIASGMIVKKLLSGLFGGPLALLASEGGSVQYKEHGGGIQAPLGPKKTANAMKVESHTKGEARKDMEFAVNEKRKQELHEKKMRVI